MSLVLNRLEGSNFHSMIIKSVDRIVLCISYGKHIHVTPINPGRFNQCFWYHWTIYSYCDLKTQGLYIENVQEMRKFESSLWGRCLSEWIF